MQVARYEQRKGDRGHTAGNHIAWKQQGSLGRQRKAGTSRLTGNHAFGDDKCPGGRQRKLGKGRNLRHPNVTFCSLGRRYNKISLADKKFPSCTDAMTLQIKTKHGQKSLLPSGRCSWGEIRDYDPLPPPSPVNILPLHFYTPHNQLAKET